MKNAFLGIVVFFILWNTASFCQDTSKTVVIKKPVFIIEERPHNFYLLIGTSFSINKDYYNVCPNNDCKTYFQNIRKTTENFWNNSYTIGLAYAPGKFYSELNVSYTRYRDKFNYTDPYEKSIKSTNQYDYWDLGCLVGYRIKKWWKRPSYMKKKWRDKTSYIVLGGIVLNKTISIEGNTLSYTNPDQVISLKEQLHFYDYNYQSQLEMRIMRRLKNNFHFIAAAYYSYDLRSIINRSELYIRQRNIIGIKLILIYNF